MIPFNYHHLYYFYTIAKLGSISKSCKELGLAQPTLSYQLKQFENYLNLKLFEREGKRLILTDEGRHVLSYAAQIVDTGRELIDGLGDISQKGRIKIQIGVSIFVPRSVIDALLQFLLKIEPTVYISIQEEKPGLMMEGLNAHRYDFALTDILVGPILEEKIESHLLAKIPVVFCAHSSIAKKYKSLPADLDNAPVILPTAQSQVYQAVQEYFVANKVNPRIIGEIQDVELVRRLALTGVGIAPINQFTVAQAPSREPLVILGKKSKHNIFDSVYLLVKRRKRHHPLVPKILSQFKLPL
jgi:LysR family transcriptional activator of nhaA